MKLPVRHSRFDDCVGHLLVDGGNLIQPFQHYDQRAVLRRRGRAIAPILAFAHRPQWKLVTVREPDECHDFLDGAGRHECNRLVNPGDDVARTPRNVTLIVEYVIRSDDTDNIGKCRTESSGKALERRLGVGMHSHRLSALSRFRMLTKRGESRMVARRR